MMGNAISTETFFSHVESFIGYRQTVYEVSDQTVRSNIMDLNLFKNFLQSHGYNSITGEAVMGFQIYLKNERLNTGSSVNRKVFSVKSYGTYLKVIDVDGAERLPFRDILKIRSGYRNGPQALSVEQVRVFFKKIDRTTYLGIRDYCIYAFMYDLGLRAGEVHGIMLGDINLKQRKAMVIGKGRKRRVLHITDEMKDIITEWLSVRKYFLHSDQLQNLFVSKKGNPVAIRTIEDNFKKILTASGIKTYFNATPHTLRHSFASHLNDKGTDILVLQSLLGHSTPRSTEIYIHPSEERVRAALEKLPGVQYMNQLIENNVVKFQKSHGKISSLKINKTLIT